MKNLQKLTIVLLLTLGAHVSAYDMVQAYVLNKTGGKITLMGNVPQTISINALGMDKPDVSNATSTWLPGKAIETGGLAAVVTQVELPASQLTIEDGKSLTVNLPIGKFRQDEPAGFMEYDFTGGVTYDVTTSHKIGERKVMYSGGPIILGQKPQGPRTFTVPEYATGSFTLKKTRGCPMYVISLDGDKVNVEEMITGCMKTAKPGEPEGR